MTPFSGSRSLAHAKRDALYTIRRDEAFRRGVQEYPEEALIFLNDRSLRKRIRMLRRHFLSPEENAVIAYAVKANPQRKILETLHEEGISAFDCASVAEIAKVQEVSPRATIFFNHPIKKNRDIRTAATVMGVRHFTVQSIREVLKIIENLDPISPSNVEIAVRLDTPNPHAGINLSEKFGAPAEEVPKIIEEIRYLGAQPGISIHTGSQNTDPQVFAAGIKSMLDIARAAGGVKAINVGGGLPANIHEGDRYDLQHFLNTISTSIRSSIAGALSSQSKIIIEPGRAMVAESMDLLIPVLSVEMRNGEPVIYIDDGVFTSFSDLVVHDWKYPFKAWRKDNKPLAERTRSFRVFGRTCDSGDCLGEIELPEDLREDDYLHVPAAGAYTDCQASQFNGFAPPRYLSYNISSAHARIDPTP